MLNSSFWCVTGVSKVLGARNWWNSPMMTASNLFWWWWFSPVLFGNSGITPTLGAKNLGFQPGLINSPPPHSQPWRRIDEITFPSASQGHRRVCFVTERCVMELRNQRLVLTELANGMRRLVAVGFGTTRTPLPCINQGWFIRDWQCKVQNQALLWV